MGTSWFDDAYIYQFGICKEAAFRLRSQNPVGYGGELPYLWDRKRGGPWRNRSSSRCAARANTTSRGGRGHSARPAGGHHRAVGVGQVLLAFDTIYAEGQRRYVESLSAYARQFLDMMGKPDVDHISGLSPAISIEQKTTSKNPRSTVGTVTEIYDYLRLLFARVGTPYSARHRPADHRDAGAGHGRCGDGDGGGHARLSAGPHRPRPQGRVPQGIPGTAQAGLPARQGQRPVPRAGGAADAGQEVPPQHRRGGRPHRGARGLETRLADSFPHRAEPGRRHRRDRNRAGRGRGPERITYSEKFACPVSRASPSPRSSRACSASTRPSAPARSATGWGWSCSSTNGWWCPTRA
jgi:hypothetical protein